MYAHQVPVKSISRMSQASHCFTVYTFRNNFQYVSDILFIFCMVYFITYFASLKVCDSNDCDAEENLVIDKNLEDCPPPSNPETTTLAETTTTVAKIDTTTEETDSGSAIFYASVCFLAAFLM